MKQGTITHFGPVIGDLRQMNSRSKTVLIQELIHNIAAAFVCAWR